MDRTHPIICFQTICRYIIHKSISKQQILQIWKIQFVIRPKRSTDIQRFKQIWKQNMNNQRLDINKEMKATFIANIQQFHLHRFNNNNINKSNGQQQRKFQKSKNKKSKTLHLNSNEIVEDRTSLFRCFNGNRRMTDVEDGAAVKGKGEAAALPDPVAVALPDLGSANIEIVVEVDALVMEKAEAHNGPVTATNPQVTTTYIRNEKPRSSGAGLHRRSSLVTKPPELLAAVFPWNHNGESSTEKNLFRSVVNEGFRLTIDGGSATREVAVRKKHVGEKAATETGPRAVTSGGTLVAVEDAFTGHVPLGFSVRERKQMLREEGGWKLPATEQLGLIRMGQNWASKFWFSLGPFKPKEVKVK